MDVVILGGGTVGQSIAAMLGPNGHNVCLVDESADVLERLEETLDIQTVRGNGCDAATLFQAGVLNAGLFLGVSNVDEVNLIGSSLARSMGADRSIARVYNDAYRDSSTFDYRRHFGVDRLLSLERLTALELIKNIRAENLFAMEHYLRGGVEIRELTVESHCRVEGKSLKELDLGPGVRVGLISDEEKTHIAVADDVLKAGQHVTLIGTEGTVDKAKQLFEDRLPPVLRVVIAGGGDVGYNLARVLERGRFSVVIIERDRRRCEELADKLDDATVLQADVTRRAEMEEARVGTADVFVAATGRDEDNIVCGVEARELGADRILSVVRRPDYANVLHKLGIDVAVSPREVMARQVLGYVQSGPVLSRHDAAGGHAEVLEIEVKPDTPITTGPLKQHRLGRSLIAAFERDGFVRVPGANDTLAAGDVAIVLTQLESSTDLAAVFGF
ncbi:MAG: Trk system potassium transporter TrkA [Planctomycetota bacterium]